MKELKVLITYEAIYDIADAEEYICYEFGQQRADEYHIDIYNEIQDFANFCSYGSSGCYYRGYTIFKKPFKPAIIFGIIIGDEVHILRVTREEYDWQGFFDSHQNHEYQYPDNPIIHEIKKLSIKRLRIRITKSTVSISWLCFLCNFRNGKKINLSPQAVCTCRRWS